MEYKELAIELAQKAGTIMRQNFTLDMNKEWKADNSPVTETDLAINRLVIEEIKKNFPKHDILAEEESHRPNDSEYVWVCDPLDGTMPFSHGIPTFTFSIALTHQGESILGVIYDPILDRLFSAEKSHGAFLNDQPIKVNQKEFGYIDLETSRLPEIQAALVNQFKNNLFKFGCCTYGGILVACGEYVGTIYKGDQAHDIAALKIIVEEAGGKVTDLFGNEQRYDQDINGAVISNGVVHDLFIKQIKQSLDNTR